MTNQNSPAPIKGSGIKKTAISCIIAYVLGALSAWWQVDLSPFQKPAEQAAEKAVDAVEDVVKDAAAAKK